MESERSSSCSKGPTKIQRIRPLQKPCIIFHNKPVIYDEELLALPHTQPSKLEDHPLSAVSDCLFNIFASSIIWRQSPPPATEDAPCFSHYFPNIHYNISFTSTPRSPEWTLPFRFSNQHFVCISELSHEFYMPRPSHHP